MLTVKLTAEGVPDPVMMRVMTEVFHREKVEAAFGTGGGGMATIEEDLAASKARHGVQEEAPMPKRESPEGAKLRALAEPLAARVAREREYAPHRLTNTRKRAEQAAQAQQATDRMDDTLKALRALADAHDAGTLAPELAGVLTVVALQTVQEYATFPADAGAQRDDHARLLRAGIAEQGQLDRARGALFALTAGKKDPALVKARKVADLERALVGLRFPGYFPTPRDLAERMADLAHLVPGARVLEPSAGKGNLVEAILTMRPDAQVDCCEYNHDLRAILDAKGFTLVGDDFMDTALAPVYDAVIMNPPFERGQDYAHVQRAWGLLRAGGTLVALVNPGAASNSDKKAVAFRALFDCPHVRWVPIAPGVFREAGSGTGAVLLVAEKE